MINIAGFTDMACKVLNLAIYKAEKLGYENVNSRHLLYGLVGVVDSISSLILTDSISTTDIEENIIKIPSKTKKKLTVNDFTPLVKKILENAKKKLILMGSLWLAASTF